MRSKLRRCVAVCTAMLMLALTACSEGNDADNKNTQGNTTTSVTTSATTKTTPKTTTTTTAAPPSSNIDVGFQTYTYRFKDAQNYEYEVTLTLSPWILESKADVLDAAWAKVGKGKAKPTKNNMGMAKYANNRYMTNLRDSNGRNRIFDATMTQMYFSVGTVSVKNVTSGWDFSNSNTGSPDIVLNWIKNINQKSLVIENDKFISKSFYTSRESTNIGQVVVKPKMSKNTWGPATVVLAHAENISPKFPNGEYSQYVQQGYLQAENTRIQIPVYGG